MLHVPHKDVGQVRYLVLGPSRGSRNLGWTEEMARDCKYRLKVRAVIRAPALGSSEWAPRTRGPTGRGAALRLLTVWVRIPPGVLEFEVDVSHSGRPRINVGVCMLHFSLMLYT